MKKINYSLFVLLFSFIALEKSYAVDSPKEATSYTKDLNATLLKELPFQDQQSFENAERGFIAPLPDGGVIKDAKGAKIWNLNDFAFIKKGEKIT